MKLWSVRILIFTCMSLYFARWCESVVIVLIPSDVCITCPVLILILACPDYILIKNYELWLVCLKLPYIGKNFRFKMKTLVKNSLQWIYFLYVILMSSMKACWGETIYSIKRCQWTKLVYPNTLQTIRKVSENKVEAYNSFLRYYYVSWLENFYKVKF